MKNPEKIKLIFGLGNPEPKFEHTRHNFGRDLVRAFMSKPISTDVFTYAKVGHLYLAIGSTYMNESGQAVKAAVKFFKIKPAELLIVSDEADLPLFWSKFAFGQTVAGHKGVESVVKALKTNKFWRLRLGIQGKKRKKAETIILKKLTPAEMLVWRKVRKRFGQILDLLQQKPIPKLSLSRTFLLD